MIEQVIGDLEEQYGYDETTATNLIYSGGLQIYSCLNPEVQKQVDAVYADVSNFSLYASRRGQELRSGITVVDNSTGAVVALAGGTGQKVGNRIWNCATDTLRPPGSSIKPLAAYAPAIEKDLILPSSAEDDTPFMQNSDGSLWPVNSEGYYSGLTDIDTAVTDSLNTVAVKVLDSLGLQTAYDFLSQQFGLTTLVTNYETSTGRRQVRPELCPAGPGRPDPRRLHPGDGLSLRHLPQRRRVLRPLSLHRSHGQRRKGDPLQRGL